MYKILLIYPVPWSKITHSEKKSDSLLFGLWQLQMITGFKFWSSGDLRSLEYTFIYFTPSSTLALNTSICSGPFFE